MNRSTATVSAAPTTRQTAATPMSVPTVGPGADAAAGAAGPSDAPSDDEVADAEIVDDDQQSA